jgi:hypothetical protein
VLLLPLLLLCVVRASSNESIVTGSIVTSCVN